MKFTIALISALAFFSTSVLSAEISWETLKTLEMDEKTKKPKIPDALKKSLSKEVTLKGFMMPLDYESKEIVEFLFMPYVPSCMHVPPPPANQLILVKMKKGTKVKPSMAPLELTGKLTVESNPDLESSYKMEGFKVQDLKNFTPPTPAGAHP